MQGMHGINNGKNDMVAMRKNIVFYIRQDTFSVSRKEYFTPDGRLHHYNDRCRCDEDRR